MIGGVNWQDYNANLEATLQMRIEDHNLTLRKEKCKFVKTTMEFYGHSFTSEGLRPSSDKIRAVEKCEPPKNREELISFLQILADLSRYISNFSSRCEPLRRLTRENTHFVWTNEQQRAFERTKERAITASGVASPTIQSRYAKFQVIIIIHFFTN